MLCAPLCCSVLLCVALACYVLLCVALACSMLLCVALACYVLLCVALACSLLLCVALCSSVLLYVALCCSGLLCVALCCSGFLWGSPGCSGLAGAACWADVSLSWLTERVEAYYGMELAASTTTCPPAAALPCLRATGSTPARRGTRGGLRTPYSFDTRRVALGRLP